jgi:hypothetical protein
MLNLGQTSQAASVDGQGGVRGKNCNQYPSSISMCYSSPRRSLSRSKRPTFHSLE